MKLIKENDVEFLVIEIPKDAEDFQIHRDNDDIQLSFFNGENIDPSVIWLDNSKPNVRYELIGKYSELTSNDCDQLVTFYLDLGYDNYMYHNLDDENEFFDNPEKSLKSLIQYHDINLKDWLDFPIDWEYIPDFGVQKHPQECYLSDKEKYDSAPEELILIKKITT